MLKTELLKISKVDENYEPTNAGSSIKPKHEENEENYTKPHHKLLKTTNKEKILKEPKKEKKPHYIQGTKITVDFSLENVIEKMEAYHL